VGKHIVGVEFLKQGQGANGESTGTMKLYVDDMPMGETPMRTMTGRYSLCGEGLCIGYDGGDAVSSEYRPRFAFAGGRVIKVTFDSAEEGYVDVERELAEAFARD
jgi:arylsulfatase